MRPTIRQATVLTVAALGASQLARERHVRRVMRRAARGCRHRWRYAEGRLAGVAYHLAGRHPDPEASGSVLADRVRSTLGPLEKRLDIPHVHVTAEDHTVLLHGDVAFPIDADTIERVARHVSGVRAVRSHLHVGLLPSDTRPSRGSRRPA